MSKPKHVIKTECAVYVRHAWKSYKKPYYVLCDLNMTMMKGTIYALLGASGCGKTSLLSCIVGIRSLDLGDVWVLGGRPGSRGSGVPGNRVGYMPQELALYGEFSINETMLYFGWIYGLKTKQIKEKVTFLVQLLDLPPAKRLVKNLSGGQQRRVSLAVAVMHEPELLILDEPTVGVDPILRANIWNYMVRETKEKKISIIITTHYIEEARQAQTIGLMRNGELLAEDAPAQLLKTFGCTTMEEVFLKLSRQQEASGKQQLPASFSEGPRRPKGKTIGENAESNEDLAEEYGCCNRICYSLKQCMSCVRLRALLFRNLLRLIRNLLVLLFVFALPVIQVVLFCICVGNDPKQLTLGVVNHETDYTNSTYIHCPYGFSCTVSLFGI
nr:unnamed protein product [Callosobruchus analis]